MSLTWFIIGFLIGGGMSDDGDLGSGIIWGIILGLIFADDGD